MRRDRWGADLDVWCGLILILILGLLGYVASFVSIGVVHGVEHPPFSWPGWTWP